MKKKYVTIHSNVTITVTSGLQNKDVTNKDAHVADRLKVNPLWPKTTVLIRKGKNTYPSEIAEWETVKALAKDEILTIGEYSDAVEDEKVVQTKDKLSKQIEAINAQIGKVKSVKSIKLDDIAGE